MFKSKYKKAYIEISNICNLQCSFCPVVEREKKIMNLENFALVLAQVMPLTEEVCLHLMGEPLAHPQFEGIIQTCEESRSSINLTTNALLLSRYPKDLLLSPCIRQINFSLHSFLDNFPDGSSVWGDLKSYLSVVLAFVDMALEKRPDLYLNFRLWNLNDNRGTSNDEILQIIGRHFQQSLKPQSEVDVTWKKSLRVKGRLYLHYETEFIWPSPHHPLRSSQGFCHALSSHFGIHADGRVVPCCLDKEAAVTLGNCLELPLQEILQGTKACGIRQGFQKHQLVEDLCKRCTYITRFDRRVEKLAQSKI